MKKKELIDLLKEDESVTLEYKQVSTLKDKDEIARQLVAFANKKGGKLVFGVTNDKIVQGKKINHDTERNRIATIAKSHCSPPVEFESFHYQLKEGEVLVIDIKKKKEIPHAVVELRQHEIYNRLYFIRTSDGTRLVKDLELKLLFLGLDIDLNHSFMIQLSIGLNFDLFTLLGGGKQINFRPYMINHPHNQNLYGDFFKRISGEDRKKILAKDDEAYKQLGLYLFDLLPYVILRSISEYYTKSWNIEIINQSPLKTRVIDEKSKSDLVSLNEIESSGETIFSEIGFENITNVLDSLNLSLNVPSKSKISIKKSYDNNNNPIIYLEFYRNKSYRIQIEIISQGWKKAEKDPKLFFSDIPDVIYRMNIIVNYSVEFDSKFKEATSFEQYYNYSRVLLELLKWNWDYDYSQEKLTPKQLLEMNLKIDYLIKDIKNIKDDIWDIKNSIDKK